MAEDLSGIPDVDLTPVLKDLEAQQMQDKSQTDIQAAKPDDTKQTDTQDKQDDLDLGQFKNTKDLLKSYKEIQGWATRISQENKAYKDEIAHLKDQVELGRSSTFSPPPQAQSQTSTEDILDDPGAFISQEVSRRVRVERITEVLEEEADKNREEFQERYAYAQMVAREYPNLTQSAAGVRKLFQQGDKLRSQYLKKNAGRALESIFGEPLGEEEITRLRTLVKGNKSQTTTQLNSDAYMPDTTSTRSALDTEQKPDREAKIREAAKQGDVDGTLAAIFEAALAE